MLAPYWLRTFWSVWLREMLVYSRDMARMAGMLGQPVFFLVILGTGFNASVRLVGAPPGLDYLRFMYPGVIAMSVLFTSIFSALSIISDREFGFLKEILVSPAPRWSVAVGKILGGATAASVQSLILVAVAPLAGLHLSAGIVARTLGLAFLISVGLTSLGVAVACRIVSIEGYQMIANFLVMPMYFLSGAMFPLSTAPAWLRALMVADPLTYGVDAMRSVMFSGTVMAGVPLLEVARRSGLVRFGMRLDLWVLAGLVVGMAWLAAWLLNRSE